MNADETKELDDLAKAMQKMIEGDMEIDRTLVKRYNELCIKRRDSEGH